MERGFTLLPSVAPDLVSWVCGPGQRPALVGPRGEADVVSLAVLGGGGGHIIVVPIAPRQGIVCTRRGTIQVRQKREGSEAGAVCEDKCCKIFVGGGVVYGVLCESKSSDVQKFFSYFQDCGEVGCTV